MIGSSERERRGSQHTLDADEHDGQVITDQAELHEPYSDDERYVRGEQFQPSAPVSIEFEYPDQG